MFLRPALRHVPCPGTSIGLRPFSSSSTTLLSRFPRSHPSAYIRAATLPAQSASRHPLILTTVTAVSAYTFLNAGTPTYNDTAEFSTSPYSHGKDAKVPLSKDGGRSLNPKAVRQISFGGLCGLGLGVLVSAFSRMLVLLVGVGIVLSQYAARRGYNIIPVERLQKYVKGVNLRSAINDNAAFKISFGLMFALTAFGDL